VEKDEEEEVKKTDSKDMKKESYLPEPLENFPKRH
jgi:hypothetical protein